MAKKSYSEKLLDPRWQQMRLRVYERDGFKCKICGCATKTLNAHHVQYHPFAEGPWDYDPDTIITLCVDCHSDEHIELEASKANVMLALVKMCDVFGSLSKNDLTQLFLEKSCGSNQNN